MWHSSAKQALQKSAQIDRLKETVSKILSENEVSVGSFLMQKTEVTQQLYFAVTGNNPSEFHGDKLPVTNISWYDALEFCNRLSVMQGLTPCYTKGMYDWEWNKNANGYRLPTEDEWEFAADDGHKYSGSDSIDSVAWFYGNSNGKAHEVATKSPNEKGVYDMSGNVYEWCWDPYSESSSYRSTRGGSWYAIENDIYGGYRYCEVSYHDIYPPSIILDDHIGLRVVRSAQ